MHIECKYNNAKLILPVMMITWRVLQGLVGEAAWELLAAWAQWGVSQPHELPAAQSCAVSALCMWQHRGCAACQTGIRPQSLIQLPPIWWRMPLGRGGFRAGEKVALSAKEVHSTEERGCNQLAPNSSKQCEVANAWGTSRWQLASEEGHCYVPLRFASAAWQSCQETSHTLLCKCKLCIRPPSWLFHLAVDGRSTREPMWGMRMHSAAENTLWFSPLNVFSCHCDLIPPISRGLSLFPCPTSLSFPFIFLSSSLILLEECAGCML